MMKHIYTVIFGVALLWAGRAHGLAPRYLSDEELAHSPIIVVAVWEKAAFESHEKVEEDKELGPVVMKSEAYTKLRILRVVRGSNLAEGEHDLLVNYGVYWSKDGTQLSSGTSTDLPGDVQDTTKPNLWFLEKAHSWDESRTEEYLSINNYRRIQPVDLEEYFLSLGGSQPETEVPRLLTPDKPELALRVLRYISGGIWPWPYDPGEFGMMYSNPEKRGNMLRKESSRVWGIATSKADKIRPYAVSVYAELEGQDCLGDIRTLLDDKDPFVRGIAIGILAHHRDKASLAKFQTAIRGVEEGRLACKLIEQLLSWGDECVVPSLIAFLQNDKFAYQIGDDLGIPAMKAKAALKVITGHDFPFDIEKSMTAWRRAVEVPDKEGRLKILKELLPDGQTPVSASVIGSGENARIEVANVSKGDIFIAKTPADVELRCKTELSGTNYEEIGKTIPSVKLAPGETVSFDIKLSANFLLADPATRVVTLTYRHNGNENGVNAWIGMVKATFGQGWKEPERKREKVEEKWPNGNFKVVGQTMNGQKCGKWNYYNEAGDRIRIVDHEGGTAECNPEHPDNKGAGIPKTSGQ